MSRRLLLILAIAAFAGPSLILRAQQQPSQQAPQRPPGTLRGIVVREGTNEPIRGVQISISRLGEVNTQEVLRTLADQGTALSAITDSEGRFTIEGIPPGQWPVTAQRDGYFGTAANSTTPTLARTLATITSQQTSEVALAMVPGSAINGRVLGPTGMPVTGISVDALRVVYQNGERTLQTTSQKQSDDRGEFRIYQLPPGEYFLAATPRLVVLVSRGLVTKPANDDPQEVQARTFYPNATDPKNALPITLLPGDDLAGMNIQLQAASGSKVSGRVISQLPAPGPIPEVAAAFFARGITTASVMLLPRNRGAYIDPRLSVGTSVSMAGPNAGTFEVQNVPAGSYDLYASLPDPTGYGPSAAPGQAVQPVSYGRTPIDVRGGDVTGVTVSVHQGVDVKGQIIVDGKPAAAGVRVSLQPADSSTGISLFSFVGRYQAPIQPDGSFLIPVVPEATYRVQATVLPAGAIQTQAALAVRGGRGAAVNSTTPAPPPPPALPATAYVSDIRQGDASIYDEGIPIGTNLVKPLEVLISTNGGTIQGTVAGPDGQGVAAGVTVVLMPQESRRQNLALYKTATTNAQGTFTMSGLPPGLYKLFAWQSIPPNAYQNVDFVKKYEDRGTAISVSAGATVSQTVTVIPAETLR